MAEGTVGILRAGAGLLWRRQGVFWWAYGCNFLLALMATLPVAAQLGRVLDNSLASRRLYKGLDLAVLIDLNRLLETPMRALMPVSFLFALLFLLFMLFLTGGVLEAYRRDQRFTTGELFRACGIFFWRFVRLLIVLLIVLVPVAILHNRVQRWANPLASDAPQEMLGFWVQMAGLAVVVLLLVAVRLWFDMAQVYAVAESERRMRVALVGGFKLAFGNFGQLFWICLRILLVAAIVLSVGLWIWVKFVRPEWVGVSFFGGQIALLAWLACRFWLRASETVWYQRLQPVAAAVSLGVPQAEPASPAAAPPLPEV